MTKKQYSIDELRAHCRDLITPEKAIEIATPWGMNEDDIISDNYKKGIDWGNRSQIWRDGDAVSVYKLSIQIVRKIGKLPHTTSSKMGRGSSAEEITFKNCKILTESISNGKKEKTD